jgi:hypothetical protein
MARIEHSDVQVAEPWKPRVFIREINSRLKDLIDVVTQNRITGGLDYVYYVAWLNGNPPIWISADNYTIEAVNAVVSAGTCSLTPKIGGVAVGSAPLSVTTTATRFPITSPKTLAPLDVVNMGIAAIGGALTVSLELRRIG